MHLIKIVKNNKNTGHLNLKKTVIQMSLNTSELVTQTKDNLHDLF